MLRSPSRATGPPGESVERMVRANEVELCVQAFGHAADPVILLIMGSAASMDWWRTTSARAWRQAAGSSSATTTGTPAGRPATNPARRRTRYVTWLLMRWVCSMRLAWPAPI